jgi:hypothetical protein
MSATQPGAAGATLITIGAVTEGHVQGDGETIA